MGKNITQLEYNQADFKQFQHCLFEQLEQLKGILQQPGFGQQPLQFGAELEMYLVDDTGQVSLSNQLLLDQINDPQFQHELNKYNLELNLSAVPQKGRPFSQIRAEIQNKTDKLQNIATANNISIVPIGILPTLKAQHLQSGYMTDLGRYQCLSKHLYQQRGDDFKVNINGEEPVSINFDDICAEGANTSFQVHMMTPLNKFKSVFNAAQLTQPLVTAISANSPMFLGNRLWDETRIALFKQSIDIRHRDQLQWQQPARVNFGFGWVNEGPWELFAQAVSLYPVVIPCITEKITSQTQDDQTQGMLPKLEELSLHMGTLWPWNRPVYDHHNNGHMRIEFRAIPAGPTSIDMLANAAFAIGLANGLSNNIDEFTAVMPFRFAEYNFYRAAQHGLDAKILWPLHSPFRNEEVAITDVIERMLPIAQKGLLDLDIDAQEVEQYLGVIEQRLQQRMTGAIWQKYTQKYFEQKYSKEVACQKLLQTYLQHCQSCQPITQWERLWL